MNSVIARWPALRAVLLTFVVVHGVVYGLHVPVLDDERLQRDYWQPLVRRVSSLAGEDEPHARARIARYSGALVRAHGHATAPLAWAYRWLVAGQTWNMFSGAEKRSFQLHVEMRRAGSQDWELLYTVHDPDATFEAERLEYRRVRAAYIAFDNGTPGVYYHFCHWLAKRVFYTYPDADEVRVRMRRLDYRDRAERLLHRERTMWANGLRVTRAHFESAMRARHE